MNHFVTDFVLSELARSTILRAAGAFLTPKDLAEASRALAKATAKAFLRHHPKAILAVRQLCGDEAELKAMEYLAQVGFPEAHPQVPRRVSGGGNRLTPPEIRALWKPASEAVREVFHGLLPETEKALTLAVSWSLHCFAVTQFDWYREELTARRQTLKAG